MNDDPLRTTDYGLRTTAVVFPFDLFGSPGPGAGAALLGDELPEALALDPDNVLAALREASRRAERVFLDIDCDVFDPAFFPAVAQPVPFGLAPQQVLRCLDAVWSGRVAGVAISEFDPARDRDD